MRGKWIFLVIFLLSLIFTGIASARQWAKIYGGPNGGEAYSIQQTSDGGYIVAGYTESFGAGGGDAWVLKLDANGNIQWQKTYGGSKEDYAYSIQQTSDGGYIVAGYTESFGAGGGDVWVLKLDANGNVQWQKTYGGGYTDVANSIQQTSDGGYIVAGSFGTAGGSDAWVLKLDADGNIQWQKTYGGGNPDVAYSIQQTSDGGYIVAGFTSSFGLGGGAWVLKLDANGNIQWQKKIYGGPYGGEAYSIQQTSDGGYIVAGSFGFLIDVWVLKLDANGNVQWQKTYGQETYGGPKFDVANSIQQTSDGGYIVAGYTESFGAGGGDVWVLKLDANGNIQWQKTYGGSKEDYANSIQQTSDGGYIVAGFTRSFGADYNNVWVLKLDANGNIPGCSIVGSSNATVKTTDATVANSSAEATNTNVTPGISNAVVKDTSVSPTEICYYESPSSPFIDVPSDHWAFNYIKAVKDAGITKGCNPPENDKFCPEDVVTRAQMAAFIIRAIEGEPTSYNANPYFADVSPTHWAFKYVQRVKERGIAQGYPGTNLYGPEDNVTREQMAKMLIMGLVSQGKISEPPSDYCASGSPFSDVDSSSWSCRYIKRLKELGITQGCNPPANDRYCPQDVVTRAQMAAFIYRAFLSSISLPAGFRFYSPTIPENGTIPLKYVMPGAGGQNVSPPLKWEGIPSGTKSLVLLMYDRHPVADNWVHWLVINIPASVTEFPEGASGRTITSPARELINSYGFSGYGGPEPPSGTGQHPYVFRLYALSVSEINLSSQPSYDEIIRAVQPYVIDYKEFVGYFGR